MEKKEVGEEEEEEQSHCWKNSRYVQENGKKVRVSEMRTVAMILYSILLKMASVCKDSTLDHQMVQGCFLCNLPSFNKTKQNKTKNIEYDFMNSIHFET
jgi:hypothetical protein